MLTRVVPRFHRLSMMFSLLVLAVGAILVSSTSFEVRSNVVAPMTNANTSLTLLFQNNLNETDDKNHIGSILLDPMTLAAGEAACAGIGETLLPLAIIQNYSDDFQKVLSYNAFAGRASFDQSYWVNNAVVTVTETPSISSAAGNSSNSDLPVLCSQRINASEPPNSTASNRSEIRIAAANNTYVGYRNQKSFRFLGIPYADTAARFTYSKIYSKTGQTINATAYGENCLQAGGGSEDCLVHEHPNSISAQSWLEPKSATRPFLDLRWWVYRWHSRRSIERRRQSRVP